MRLYINVKENESINYYQLKDVMENLRQYLIEGINISWEKVNSVNIKKAVIDFEFDVDGYNQPVVLTSEKNLNELLEVEVTVDSKARPIITHTNEKESNLSDLDQKIIEGLDTDFKPIESNIGYENNVLIQKATIGEYEIDLYSISQEESTSKLVKRYYKDTSLIQEVLYEPKIQEEYNEIIENFKKSYLGK